MIDQRGSMRLVKSCGAFALLVVALIGLTSAAKVAVSPLGIDFDLLPGATHFGSFTVKNTGEDAQDITVTLNDYDKAVTGENRYYPAGTLAYSLATFVTFSPATFRLEPGRVQEVSFKASLPEEALGPHWMMFFVQESTPTASTTTEVEGQEGGFAFNVNVVFGVQVRQTDPSHRVVDGRVTRIRVETLEGGGWAIRLAFENTGTTFLLPKGRVEVRDRTGKTAATIPIEEFRILPGATRELTVLLEEPLSPGQYIALGIIDFGAEFLVAGQAGFEVKAP